MKKFLSMLAIASVFAFSACNNDDDDDPPAPTPSNQISVTGSITANTTWNPTKVYLLSGQVFVNSGVTLTIPAGTVIKGEKRTKGTIIVRPGGKIEACGTATSPIVFTSNQETNERDKGDWGGIILLGNANCNQNAPAIEGVEPAVTYGTLNSTANDGESSGSFCYVRVEYAGISLSPNNETNSITMGGVGRGTKMEFVQVSYGGDDGFEWFGGTINGKNLISFGTWDDDFDCDFGWSGNVQFGLVVRDPFQGDQSGSNAFECDNDATGSSALPITSGVFSNITVFGPQYLDTLAGGNALSANYQHAMHLRRRTAVSIFNSIIGGFPRGLNIDGGDAQNNYSGTGLATATLENNILYVLGQRATPAWVAPTGATAFVYADGNDSTYWLASSRSNSTFRNSYTAGTVNSGQNFFDNAGISRNIVMKSRSVDGNTAFNYPADPTELATVTGNALTGAAFTNSKLTTTLPANFFTTTTYRGAFANGTDWTNGWSNFFPQSKKY